MNIDFGVGNSSLSVPQSLEDDLAQSVRARAPVHWPTPPRYGAPPYERLLASISLERLSELEVDWDGYGAEPLPERVISHTRAAIKVLADGAPMPELIPNPNGTLSLEWTNASTRAHLEIGEKLYSFLLKAPGRTPLYASGELEQLELSNLAAIIADAVLGCTTSPSTRTNLHDGTVELGVYGV